MKATYQKPSTAIVEIFTVTHLLDASKNGMLGDDPTKAKFNLDENFEETGASSGNLSRRSVWDDEEEEDF